MTSTYRIDYLNERGSYQSRRVEAASLEEAERRVRAEADRDGESFGQLISVWGHTATLRASVPRLDTDGVSPDPVTIKLSYTRGAPHTITLTAQNSRQKAVQDTTEGAPCTTWVLKR